MIFSMVLPRTPRSVRAEKAAGYKTQIENIARTRFLPPPIGEGRLYARIIWFARKKGGPDVDNIVKPILDALRGVVYEDDSQIDQCLATKIDLTKLYSVSANHISSKDYQELIDLLGSPADDILYIEVGRIPGQQAVFGPIDGDTP